MFAGIASLARNVPKIFRGTKNVSGLDARFGHLPRSKPRTNLSDLKNVLTKHITKENPIDMGSEVAAARADPKYQIIGGGIEGSGPSIYRGRTLIDDPVQISTKKQMNVLRDNEKFFTNDPIEAAHHGYAHQSADNPSVILRMAKEAADTRSPTTPFGRQVLPHGHSIVSNEQEATIPVLMNLIVRLKKMGFKDAGILSYLKQIYGSDYPKQFFKSGGIASLML